VAVDVLPPTVDIPGVQKSVVITITARVVATAPAGQTIPNAANLTYTSLPGPNGTTTNPTGSSTPGASGTNTGERNGSNGVGGLNDYVSSANVSTTLATPTIEKLAPSPLFYAVGQQVTYPLRVTLPEGVTRDLVVFDDLPAGMAYVGYQVITSAAASGGLLTADFGGSVPTPTVTAPGGSGDDVTLTFGDTTTTDDNDPNNNRFLVQITAVVLNVAANQDGTVLTNSAQLRYTDPNTGNTVTVNAPQSPTVTVVEPVLELHKTIITPPSPPDAGGVVTYRILINHAANSHSAAYDVVFTDTIPSGISGFSNVYVTATGITPPTFEIVGNQLRVPSTADGSFDLPLGATVTIVFDATLAQSVQPDQVITNTGHVAWTSTDGPNSNERTGDTSDPGGALNDYRTSDSASLTVDGLQVVKSLVGTSAIHTTGSEVTIGEVITYQIALTLPEGTLSGLTVVDLLPEGLAYVMGSAAVDTSAFNGTVP
ncbi:MAG: isopeptide-forming domain-containing fimbrial protein, partial [Chloroflexi bacterium]|nr:isopeptide-forming domain-containing fimbrial protein [Chloroflexota bacterium]